MEPGGPGARAARMAALRSLPPDLAIARLGEAAAQGPEETLLRDYVS